MLPQNLLTTLLLSEWTAYKTIDSEEEMRNFLSQFSKFIARSVVRDRPEYQLIAVDLHPEALKACPKSSQTHELVKTAVARDGNAIRFASKKVLKAHPELYRIAVSSNGAALFAVPEGYRDKDMCRVAISTYGRAIGAIPESDMTPELIASAIEQDPTAIEYVPEEFLDYSTCIAAVQSCGKMLAVVPLDLVDKGLCMAAVSNDGRAIKHVPIAFFDRDVQIAAVKNNGLALKMIPANMRSQAVCESAVVSDALALEYVPSKFVSDDMIRQAVTGNGLALRFVENPDLDLCEIAVDNDGSALQFVPEANKTAAMCRSAFEKNWRMITHVPAPMVDKEMLLRATLEEAHEFADKPYGGRVMHIGFYEQLDPVLLQDPEIATIQRKAGVRRVVSASWDDSAKHFKVEEALIGREFLPGLGYEELTRPLSAVKNSFEELCSYLNGDLGQVDFGAFDFSEVKALPECVIETTIPSDALIRLNVYDRNSYSRYIENDREFAEALFSRDSNEECLSLENCDSPLDRYRLSDETPFYYISDIHLNHKLVKRFPDHASASEIAQFIEGFVEGMVGTVPSANRYFPLLVLGDVSYNFDIAEEFYAKLVAKWHGPIVCILGNHELWCSDSSSKPTGQIVTVETIVEEYREMLERHNVVLLENEMLVKYRDREFRTISQIELRKRTDHELQSILRRCSTIIVGGLGFTAFSNGYTAADGLYRKALRTLQEDEAYTSKFRDFYDRIVKLVPDKTVVVATHTPMHCWSHSSRHPGWIYLNGHTHRNSFELTDSYRVYEDNQVGYRAMSAGLKRFLMHPAYDVFKYHDDGIHVVSRADYLDFCREHSIDIESFTRKGDVIMLKRDGLYCFLLKMDANEKYYLLEGGRIHALSFQDPGYYYERMKLYSDLTKAAFSGYNTAIRTIGREIARLGGTGKVHGCIVDIDFLNHVYLDPFTGELKFYHAESIARRIEYPSIDRLLKEHVPSLLPSYNRLITNASKGEETSLATVTGSVAPPFAQSPDVSYDTSMYRPSNVVRSVQYLFDTNVIRNWNDAVLEGATDDEIAASNAAPKRLYEKDDYSLNA